MRFATQVYKEAVITGERLASHIKYYNFEQKVYKNTFDEGTEFVQFRRKGYEGSGGDYYASAGTKPQEIGLDPDDVGETYKVTLINKVEGLASSHKRNTALYYDATRRSTGAVLKSIQTRLKR